MQQKAVGLPHAGKALNLDVKVGSAPGEMGNITDYRAEIPARAFINALIVDRAVETDALATCVQRVLQDAGFAPAIDYQFKNPAFIVGLLYCLIVVPKEIWLPSKDDPVYKRLEATDLVDLFTITRRDTKVDEYPVYYLIHHLRNAVAHANFSIDQSQAFTFWDQSNKTKPHNWEASIPNVALMRFLSKLAHVVVYLRDDPTRNV